MWVQLGSKRDCKNLMFVCADGLTNTHRVYTSASSTGGVEGGEGIVSVSLTQIWSFHPQPGRSFRLSLALSGGFVDFKSSFPFNFPASRARAPSPPPS